VSSTQKPGTSPLIDLMFQAFCHRLRLRILHLLHEGEMCVGNLVEILQSPQPKVSRHLAVLKKAKLVTVRREGQWIHYALAPVQSTFHQKLLECAANCFHEVTEIQADKERLDTVRSLNSGCCVLPANVSRSNTQDCKVDGACHSSQ
jgi:ArsR family transcriptional regulator